MLKRTLIAVAAVALLATVAQAGELKYHQWPCALVPQELTTIPVVMDIGYFIRVRDQDKLKIKLVQLEGEVYKFSGCTEMTVDTNFKVQLSASISKTGAVPGDYSISTFTPSVLEVGKGQKVKVCVDLKNAGLDEQLAGTSNVHVATVKIKAVPAV